MAAAVATGVTGTRLALQAAWPDFREASERSNKQVGVYACLCLEGFGGLANSRMGCQGWWALPLVAAGLQQPTALPTHALRTPETCPSSHALGRPQVLAPLAAGDLLWVAALPAVSEELLFRGALIPAVYPDW